MLTLPRGIRLRLCMMSGALLVLVGCANAPQAGGGTNGALTAPIGPPGYQMEAAAGPGKDAAAFHADYAACERQYSQTDAPSFFSGCMRDAGNSVRLSSGRVLGSTQQDTQQFQSKICRNFASNFTDQTEALTQCMSSLGNAVTRPDGTVIPPRSKFSTQLVLVRQVSPPAAPPAATPPTPADNAPSSQPSAADNHAAADLLRILLNAVRIAGMSRQSSSSSSARTTSSSSTSSQATSDEPNPFGSMMGNYATCGDMWGCWAH